MKVDVKTNQLMRRLTFIGIALTLFVFILEFNYPPQLWLQVVIVLIYTRLSWYLISVLQFAGEVVMIQTPFTIILVLYILKIFAPFLMQAQVLPLDVFYIIIVIYATLMTFKIKNPQFSNAFRIYGIFMLINVLLNSAILVLIFFSIYTSRPNYLNYLGLLNVLPLYAILNITRKVKKTLDENSMPILPDITP